jgi:hypothetical protein
MTGSSNSEVASLDISNNKLGAEGANIIAVAIKVLWLCSAVIGCRSSASVLASKHIIMHHAANYDHLIIHKESINTMRL